MLTRLGHQVDTVSNGLEAVRAAQQASYDVVLMDIHMPELDGLGAAQRIRADLPPHRQPRILAVSASGLAEDRSASADAGMDDFLTKPLRLHELDTLLSGVAARSSHSPFGDPLGEPDTSASSTLARMEDIRERLVELAGPDPADDLVLFSQLLRGLVASAPASIADIEQAARSNDPAAVAMCAHNLRGSVANLGGNRLAGLLDDIEQRGRLGRAADAQAIARARRELVALSSSFLAVADEFDQRAVAARAE